MCMCVYARAFTHTRALGWSVRRLKSVYRKGWWQVGAMRSFTDFYFGKVITTAPQWGKTPASPLLRCWLCQRSKPPKAQPPAMPSWGVGGSDSYRCAGRTQMCWVLALCSAPRASCESWGAGVLEWGAAACCGLPELFFSHLPGVVHRAREQ